MSYSVLLQSPWVNKSDTAVVSCYCFVIVVAVIVLGLMELFLLFVLMYSQRVASHSCEILRELLHDPGEIVCVRSK